MRWFWIFVLLWTSVSLAFTPISLPRAPKRPGGQHLRPWFKRDLQPYDQRYQVTLALKKMRSLIARSEALGLTPTQKSSLIGLKNALEKDMVKTMRELKKLSRQLKEELNQPQPDEALCLALQKEMNQLWGQISLKALQTLFKAYQMLPKEKLGTRPDKMTFPTPSK